MAQAFFFDLQAINAGKLRPEGHDRFTATRVGVLGAGMMGAGIAYVCARAGMDVVLKDVSLEAAERGRGYTETLNAKGVERGRLSQADADELLARITPTAEASDLVGCDLLIEAVFEDPSLKHEVYAEAVPHVNPDALLCSNTSTLPITELASGVDRPADFIGLHFFSPVDKMPLVEIIKGRRTSDAALAKAYDVVLQIRKTPIVVNDSRGFCTSRVIGTMVDEGLAMLAEGLAPMSLERAAMQAGYPVGPLQLSDELNMELMAKIAKAAKDAAERDGTPYDDHPGTAVVARMIELGRPSRLKGAGFYDYGDGRRTHLWAGLADEFPVAADQIPFADVKDRLMFIEALETARCFEEGVIESSAAANIGSVMGIGFPANSGGAAQFMTGYQAVDERGDGTGPIGLATFVTRADELADRYGERFRPTAYLRDLVTRGGRVPV
jgi:3-hydroxyacyl-CoA dehydrogenase/enoyl-CoA hydratase/3-hydroxybutyryl-CoA epimerase